MIAVVCRECGRSISARKDGKWAWLSKRCYEHWKAYNSGKHKLHYERHRDAELERNRKYRSDNAERLRAQRQAAWAEEKLLPLEERYQYKWRRKNKKKVREYSRRWRQQALAKNPRFYADRERDRRARKLGTKGRHTKDEWDKLVVEFGHRCAYCLSPADLTEDHLVPLARGGSDFIENILPACRQCNEAKGARDTANFIRKRVRSKRRAEALLARLKGALESVSLTPIKKWVKVTDKALIDDLRRIADAHGCLSWILVRRHGRYGHTTYRRRVDLAKVASELGVVFVKRGEPVGAGR